MRYSLILSLLIAIPCWSQTTTTGNAETKGPCSPAVTSSANQFIINCPGIGRDQGQKMLAILNKILAKQLDPNTVMTKLDQISSGIKDIQHRTGDRVLSESQADQSAGALSKSPEHISVVLIGNREANAYGKQIIKVLQDAGWTVSVNFIGVMAPPTSGIVVSGSEGLLNSFKAAGIDVSEGRVPMNSNLLVGLRPY